MRRARGLIGFTWGTLWFSAAALGYAQEVISRYTAPGAMNDGGSELTEALGLIEPATELAEMDARFENLESLSTLLGVLMVGGFMFWLHRSYRNIHAFGRPPQSNPAWAVFGFVVPILNFFKPYQLVEETWRRCSGSNYARGAGWILPWWLSVWLSRLVTRTLETQQTDSSPEAVMALGVILGVLESVPIVLGIVVVWMVTMRQELNVPGGAEAVLAEVRRHRPGRLLARANDDSTPYRSLPPDTLAEIEPHPSRSVPVGAVGGLVVLLPVALMGPGWLSVPTWLLLGAAGCAIAAAWRGRRGRRLSIDTTGWINEAGTVDVKNVQQVRIRREWGDVMGWTICYGVWAQVDDGEVPLMRGLPGGDARQLHDWLRARLQSGDSALTDEQ